MKPHKHAELIKAWADGAEIECKDCGAWYNAKYPRWQEDMEYRIKPEPKPDVRVFLVRTGLGWQEHSALHWGGTWIEGFEIVRDGETRKLKSAEVLK